MDMKYVSGEVRKMLLYNVHKYLSSNLYLQLYSVVNNMKHKEEW